MRNKRLISLAALGAIAVAVFIFNLQQSSNLSDKEFSSLPPSGAMQAMDFFAGARAYPNKVIPDDATYREYFDSKQRLFKPASKAANTSEWRLLGPLNIGGRTLAIAVNPLAPNTLYAGSASGGLWRSRTSGRGAQAWEYVETGHPVLAVAAVAIDHADTSVIYIGTGEVYGYQNSRGGRADRTTRGSYGVGILKTTDGGVSWEKSLDWSLQQKRGVQKIAIHPQNSDIVYAATTEGVFKTTDAGISWEQVHDVVMATDVNIHPNKPEIVFVACGGFGSAGAAVYRTKDGGGSWDKMNNGLPTDYTGKTMLDISPSSPDVIYADVADAFIGIGLYRSDDCGESWRLISSRNIARFQGWYSHYVAIHPENPETIFAGGVDFWRSLNGGVHFSQQTDWRLWRIGERPRAGERGGVSTSWAHADHHDFAFDPSNPDRLYLACDGGVFVTEDNGRSFENLTGGYATTQFYNGFSNAGSDSNFAIGGMQDNASAIYLGDGDWRRVSGGDGAWTAIHPTSKQIVFASSQRLGIRRSSDGGNTFVFVADTSDIPTRDYASFIAPYMLSPSQPSIIYAATDRVYKSLNSAMSWRATGGDVPLDGNPILSMAISFTSSDIVYVGTAPFNSRAGIYRTVNGGLSWENITRTLPDRYPMDIAVDPTDAQKIYVAFSGFDAGHLWKTTDGGLNWEDISQDLPNVPASAVIVDPEFPDNIYFGNDLGVYVSTDGGADWEEWMTGLPTVLSVDLSLSPRNRAMRLATHGSGVWERPLIDFSDPGEQLPPPETFQLHPAFPNPVRQSRSAVTQIRFELLTGGDVTIFLYNSLGQRVATIVDGQAYASGRFTIPFDTSSLAAGVYFYRLISPSFSAVQKMLVIR